MRRSRKKQPKGKTKPGRNRRMSNVRPGKRGYVSRRITNSPAAQVMGLEGGPEAVGELFRFNRQWHTDKTQSVCQYPIQTGTCGNPDVIDGHTISESILNRVGERPPVSQEVMALSFSLDIAGLTERIAKPDTELSRRFYLEKRWAPEPIGIGKASMRFFSCSSHDEKMVQAN